MKDWHWGGGLVEGYEFICLVYERVNEGIFLQGRFLLLLSFVFEIGSHTAQTSLELDTQPRMTLTSRSHL